jgi:hypothetical protein
MSATVWVGWSEMRGELASSSGRIVRVVVILLKFLATADLEE